MIDFEITLQGDELLHRDPEKMSLISEIMLRTFLRKFKGRGYSTGTGTLVKVPIQFDYQMFSDMCPGF